MEEFVKEEFKSIKFYKKSAKEDIQRLSAVSRKYISKIVKRTMWSFREDIQSEKREEKIFNDEQRTERF